ncbi:hypothetical protein AB0D57_24325 [Streptomyces sp. NPDC048275]|uniref:hypothetical protein n=1 Tax=Streptomyces sp. NPDC048275 TaxID=3155629 RepID=UPI0033DDA021
MGSWIVIAQCHYNGDHLQTAIIREVNGTKEQALGELRAVVHTYRPRTRIIEQWRRVYRLADGESYFVLIKGRATLWHCTLQVAELVSDSADQGEVRSMRAEETAADLAVEPQDRTPRYWQDPEAFG